MNNRRIYWPAARLSLLLTLVVAALVGGLTLLPSAQAVSPTIVISQVYGGGGNAGATLKNDFIELFNRGTVAVDVSTWSVQYASSTGGVWQKTDLSGTIQPGKYYLVQQQASGGGTVDLPTPDATGNIPMSGTNGKVALVTNQTLLACGATAASCLPNPVIQDFVGYGAANNFEGSGPVAALSNTTAGLRAANGCTDTDNNAADFATGAPNPRNSSTAAAVCADSPTSTPTTTGTPATSTPTTTGTPATSTPTATATVTPSPTGTGTPARIHQIQGASHLSPRVGTTVSNVPGIVTVVRPTGFYLQDPNPDTDPATSEAIFVFTNSAPTVSVGASVLVSGTVAEFRPGGSGGTNNLTLTQISSPTVVVQSNGNSLPAPIVIGIGGRVPPSMVIEDDAAGNVETSGTFDPANDGIDFYESLEAMRVQLNNAVAVGPTNDFGEIPVVGDNGANASVRTNRGGVVIRPDDFNPERVFLDDTFGVATPAVNVGATFPGAIVGIMDYSFGNFKLQVTSPLSPVASPITREITADTPTNQLSVATFNVENLDPTDPAAQFAELAGLIVTNLKAPDLIAVEEIQDNNGPTNDAVVDATTTYNTLIAAITAAGGPTYQFRNINPVDDQDGGEPGGNIRVGFLFRTDRGLAFVDRPGGGPTTSTTVVNTGSGPQLSASPGRIDPTNPAFNNSRKPLAGEFTYNGKKLFAIANHFNSKGGDQPLFGRFQPPTRSSEVQRLQQAQIVNNFVDSILALDPNANVIVLGDLNDFEFSDVINTLEGGVLHTLIETLPQSERYTYVFEGNSQALDHILVSDNLFNTPFSYDVVHVNAEFADQASDHDPQVARFDLSDLPYHGYLPLILKGDTPLSLP